MLSSNWQDLTLRLRETMDHILQNSDSPPVENALLAATHYALTNNGKMLRGCMLLGACCAVGGETETALFAAAAVEYLHLGTLIHDDIIDRDEVRRGQPSVWKQYSPDLALLSGDWLYFAAYQSLVRSLADCSVRLAMRVLNIFSTACMDLCLGQASEEKLAGNCSVSYADYLEVARLKTACLFRAALQIGTLLGGGDDSQTESAGQYADHLGVAFQIIDDLLPFTSSSQTIGKAVTSDIKNRRLTAPILSAFVMADETDREMLRAIFEDGRFAHQLDDAYLHIREILTRTNAVKVTEQDAEQRCQQAIDILYELPPNDGRDYLMSLASRFVQRNK